MAENFELKNIYNEEFINRLAINLKKGYPELDVQTFTKRILDGIEPLSLIQRAEFIAETMREMLPNDFNSTAIILEKSFGKELDNGGWGGMESFYYMAHSIYIMKYGLQHFDKSIHLLLEITKRFTSEFAIRTFITNHEDKMMPLLHEWTSNENKHIRRLVSEGTRTRLPWASRLPQFIENPYPILELLEKLKADDELYVRRSVANNLNDIAKDHPDLVIKTLTKWAKSKNEGTQWIIKHATRTLIKAGHTEALTLLGYNPNVKLNLKTLSCDKKVKIGDSLTFSFAIKSEAKKSEDLMIDYVVYYMKANGKLAPKVFKLAKKPIAPNEEIAITKKQSFKLISTRKFHVGMHKIAIQINGKEMGEVQFELTQ